MKLFVKERIVLPTIFPEKNTFAKFNLKKSILNKVALKDKDIKKYEIKSEAIEGEGNSSKLQWNVDKDLKEPIEVDFTKDELEYISQSCEAISDQEINDDVWEVVSRIYDESI